MNRFLSLLIIYNLLIAALAFAEENQPVKIGALFSLSSWGAEGGTAELNGARLAVEEINRSGGINGRPLELIVEDNRSDLKASASAFRKLSSVDRVPAIIGPNWSEFIDVVAPLAERDRVPVVTPSGYKERHIKPDPWVFVLWPPPSVATKVLADKIVRDGPKRVAVLISENAYYQGILTALQSQLEASGVKVGEVLSFQPGTVDYRSAISRLAGGKSDAIIALLLESGEFAAFLRQRAAQRLSLPLYGANTLPFDKTVQNELSLAEGLVYFDYVAAGGKEFARKYRDRFASDPGFGSAKAYDGMFLIAEALRVCGLERHQVRECLRKVDYLGASGSIRFSETGIIEDSTPNTALFAVRNAKIESVM